MYKSSISHHKRMDHDYEIEFNYDDEKYRKNKLILKNISSKNFSSKSKSIENFEIDDN